MSASQHEDIRRQILSSKGKILCEFGECFVVQRHLSARTEYRIATVIEYANGNRQQTARVFYHADQIAALRRHPEQIAQILDELRLHSLKLAYSASWRQRILDKTGGEVIAEGADYIILKIDVPARDSYTLEAPMHGKSGMANQFPWMQEITPQQAADFVRSPEKILPYYQTVRYKK